MEDLLKDELAGEIPVGTWECALQSLFLRTDRANFTQYRLRHLRKDAVTALATLQRLMLQAEQMGYLKKADPEGELIKFTAGLSAAVEALTTDTKNAANTTPEIAEIRSGLVEAVEEEVYQQLERQERFYKIADEECKVFDLETKDHLASAFISLEKGFSQYGDERMVAIRDSRYESNLVLNTVGGDGSGLASLLSAITEWKMTRSAYEAERILRRCWTVVLRDHDLMTHIMGRLMGNLLLIEDDPRGAWEPLLESAEVENDPDTILEACQVAIELNKWDQARRLIERGAENSVLFLIRLLASPLADAVAGDIFTVIVNRQKASRQRVQAELTGWHTDLRRIKHARKHLEIELEFLTTMDTIRRALVPKCAGADLIMSTCYALQAINGRGETKRMALDRFRHEHVTACDNLELAKSDIGHAWAERDAMVDSAVRNQKQEADRAREALRSSLAESEKNHAGCVLGFGSGCGAFLLYLMLAAVLATQGVEAGFGTVFGWFGLAAAGIPVLFTVLMQLGYGVQRVALDATLHEKIKATEAAYDAAVKKADQFYREKVLHLRGSLSDMEARVAKTAEALQMLNASA